MPVFRISVVGTVMICCGCGPTLEKFWCRFPDPDNIWHSFQNNKKFVQNILPFQCQTLHYLPRGWPLILDFLTFSLNFILDPDPKSGSGTVMHSGSSSAKAKSYGFRNKKVVIDTSANKTTVFMDLGNSDPALGIRG
jgi:hypothetical protein